MLEGVSGGDDNEKHRIFCSWYYYNALTACASRPKCSLFCFFRSGFSSWILAHFRLISLFAPSFSVIYSWIMQDIYKCLSSVFLHYKIHLLHYFWNLFVHIWCNAAIINWKPHALVSAWNNREKNPAPYWKRLQH